MHECPLCGAPMPDVERIQVDLDQNIIVIDGKVIHLKPTAAELAHALHSKYPSLASKDYIFNQVWGNLSEIINAHSHIRTQVHYLRKRIAETPLSIVTNRTRGFRFALDVASGQMVA